MTQEVTEAEEPIPTEEERGGRGRPNVVLGLNYSLEPTKMG